MTLRQAWLTVGWLGVAAVVVLSLIPSPPELLGVQNEDKLEHVLAYALLMWWFAQAWLGRQPRVTTAAGLVALGVAIEFVQGWSGLRTFSPPDMAADAVGVAAGWLLAPPRLGNVLQRVQRAAGIS